jgi:NTP pyrophosphatase (non-canonical NTP hydrolase)
MHGLSPGVIKSYEARLKRLNRDADFQRLVELIGEINTSNGFHDESITFGDEIALMHSEISEALEEFRNGHHISEIYFVKDKKGIDKPEGIPIELADVIIRVMDTAYEHDIDLYNSIILKLLYNIQRPYRHGNKVL